jgi:hypothetical protein
MSFAPSGTAPVTVSVGTQRFSYYWEDKKTDKALKDARKAFKRLPREFRDLVDVLVELSFADDSDITLVALGGPLAYLTGDEPRRASVARVRKLTQIEVDRLHGAFAN